MLALAPRRQAIGYVPYNRLQRSGKFGMSRFEQITDVFPIFTSLDNFSVFTRSVVSHDRHGGPLSCDIHPTIPSLPSSSPESVT
jgi:hypothetical protein